MAALAEAAVAVAGVAKLVGETPPLTEELLPRLLEECAGLGPGTGGATTRLGADALCGVMWRQVFRYVRTRERVGSEGGGGLGREREGNKGEERKRGKCIERHKQSGRLADRPTDRSRERQDRQTDRHTDRPTEGTAQHIKP